MFIFSRSKWLVFISPEAPPHPPRGLSPARACCRQLPAQPWGQLGEPGCSPPWDGSGCLYLYAGIPGLAIMMDSRWKRPSPKYLPRGEAELWHWGTAAPRPRVHWFPKLQHRGDARNPSSPAGTQGQRAQPGLHGMAGLERQPCSEQGGVLTPARGGWELLHLNGCF